MTYQKSKRKNFEFFILNFKFNFAVCNLQFKIFQAIVVLLIVIFIPRIVIAEASNNKFGIHLAQPHLESLKEARELINSSGGDWGYVTVVLQENDKNKEKWQLIFDQMREFHLIPIVRLATVPEGENWRRPKAEEADGWVNFLDSLNWPVKNRYIILFNEPNHGQEWGGEVDPNDYAKVALAYAEKLKKKNKDFFIMLAGLDASAPSAGTSMEDEEIFLKQLLTSNSSLLTYIDGLASHSYPNPGFAGSPYDAGRKSIRGYEWELELLKSQGINKDLPVFITETGWRGHSDLISQNYKTAFEQVWLSDDRVKAITPFILDYQGEPFLDFSWKRFQSSEFYPQYELIQSMAKTKGEPAQIEKGEIRFDFPKELVTQSNFHFRLKLKNTGQAIWDKDNGYALGVWSNEEKKFEYLFSDLSSIKPFEEDEVDFYLKTDGLLGKHQVAISLLKNGKPILQSQNWDFDILPLPQIKAKVNLYPKILVSADDFEIQIFDEKEELVFKKKNIKFTNNEAVISNIQNIAFGRKYRIVVLRSYYLPRQSVIVFQKGANEVKFKLMYPIDFNQDGKLDGNDLPALFKDLKLLRLFFP